MSEPNKRRRFHPLWILLGLSFFFFIAFTFISTRRGVDRGTQLTSPEAALKGPAALFKKEKGVVGVIELNGVIMDSRKFIEKFEKLEESSRVKAIVLRINSPGGSVAPSQEIYEKVKSSKKPVVASMGSVAASGGFYAAMGAEKVFANPGTLTGSIGVIMEFANLEKLYEWAKIKRYSIKTGRFKDAGAEYKDMSPEDRELFQKLVDDVLSQFTSAVAARRKLPLEEVTKVADGRIFTGAQAFEAKLVDQLGTFDDAVLEAGKLGKIDGKPALVRPARKPRSFAEFLLEDREDELEDGANSWVHSLVRLFTKSNEVRGIESTLTGAPGVYWIWKGGM